MNEELKKLNFNKLLILDENIHQYNFDIYVQNGRKHKIKGYCIKCEEKKCNIDKSGNFKLKYISHGASSDEFIQSTGQKPDDDRFKNWKNDGVMFIFENPSKNYDLFEKVNYNGYEKWPSKVWYWLPDDNEVYTYPINFEKAYGKFIKSIIFTFQLKNVYVTNLVKCGLFNDNEDQFKGIAEEPNILDTCFNEFLINEISILNPKVIFCFSDVVYKKIEERKAKIQKKLNKEDIVIKSLPHPTNRNFNNEYFSYICYTKIIEGLYESSIYNEEETKNKLFEIFKLIHYPKRLLEFYDTNLSNIKNNHKFENEDFLQVGVEINLNSDSDSKRFLFIIEVEKWSGKLYYGARCFDKEGKVIEIEIFEKIINLINRENVNIEKNNKNNENRWYFWIDDNIDTIFNNYTSDLNKILENINNIN
jgi:hypothetical protein